MGESTEQSAPAGQDVGTRYRNPALAVDGVVLHRQNHFEDSDSCSVLLVKRGRDPFRGLYALPGGFVDYGEDIDLAINREIHEETGLQGLPFRQFHTYGKPGRDPRGHTVSVVYVAVIIGTQPEVVAGDDAADAKWFSVENRPEIAFDSHRKFVDQYYDEK